MPQKPKSEKPPRGLKLKKDAAPSAAGGDAATGHELFENLGDLPRTYGVDTIFLVAQEPHWLFTYWDIDIARHPGGAAFLRYYRDGGELEGELEVPFESRNWYIPIERSATEYHVEIGFHREKAWHPIARSATVMTPPEDMATSESFDYATIPFHLSFQRLMENVENAAKSGENLLCALSRLQKDGDFSTFGDLGFYDLLSEDQRTLLGAMLGPDFEAGLSSGAFSSTDIEARIHSYLEEHLGSGGASEFLSSFRESGALFSGGQLSSETPASSWGAFALASWVSAAGSSWSASAAPASWTQETLSSAFASWAQAALASWGQAGGASGWGPGGAASSFSLGGLSSWLQGAQSSWAQAALTSWPSAEASSWFSAAAVTSWSGGSETLSSFGGQRDFFMHVNAEVIFYGGTDPRAKVTINGQPVTLNPDGTFRYHYVFPNADYRIDIVAESPDAAETRSATLDFQRATAKSGVVTDTPQPPLGEPMGRIP